MYFKAKFMTGNPQWAVAQTHPQHIGLANLQALRDSLDNQKLHASDVVGIIDGFTHTTYEIDLTEAQAAETGHFDDCSEVVVRVPEMALNKFVFESNTGRSASLKVRIYREVDKSQLTLAWLEAGAPLTWHPNSDAHHPLPVRILPGDHLVMHNSGNNEMHAVVREVLCRPETRHHWVYKLRRIDGQDLPPISLEDLKRLEYKLVRRGLYQTSRPLPERPSLDDLVIWPAGHRLRRGTIVGTSSHRDGDIVCTVAEAENYNHERFVCSMQLEHMVEEGYRLLV